MGKIFGIDLGTTNSAIGYDGKVIKNKLIHSEATVDGEYYENFKIDMTTAVSGQLAIECSRQVLEKLKAIPEEVVKDVVISVPADFSNDQREATRKAAELAGLNCVALINEPTAAALAFNKSGRPTVVYDLGGGTFDIAIVNSVGGIYDVLAFDGNTRLGGRDLDDMFFKHIIKTGRISLMSLSKEQYTELLCIIREAKVHIQKTGKPVKFDISGYRRLDEKIKFVSVSVEKYKSFMHDVFDKTVVMTKRVIQEAYDKGLLSRDTGFTFLLVGGSTHCPYLREYLEEQISAYEILDPDYIVCKGASIKAKLIEDGEDEDVIFDITHRLAIETADGKLREIIPKGTKIPCSEVFLSSNATKASKVLIKLYQGDGAFARDLKPIGTMIYELGKEYEATAARLQVTVEVDASGIIHLVAKRVGGAKQEITLRM